MFKQMKPQLEKINRNRPNPALKKKKPMSSSSRSGASTTYNGPTTTPEDFAVQREALDKLLKDMAAVQQRQTELDGKVAQLQQQNAELEEANSALQTHAATSEAQQQYMKGRLHQTFQFMVQLWEQMKSEGGTIGNAKNKIKRLPFNDMQGRSVIHALEDQHRNLEHQSSLDNQQASSSTTSSRLASAMRESGVRNVTSPRFMSRSNSEIHPLNSEVRPLRRRTSRESSFFSNPGTSSEIGRAHV